MQTFDGLQFGGERRRLPVVERHLFVGAPFRDRLALVGKPNLGICSEIIIIALKNIGYIVP